MAGAGGRLGCGGTPRLRGATEGRVNRHIRGAQRVWGWLWPSQRATSRFGEPTRRLGGRHPFPLHGDSISFVNPSVTCLRPILLLLALSAGRLPGAESVDLGKLLKGVENRYNSLRTLELTFEQTYIAPNRARRVESGSLRVRKPGRMRWEYTKPDGKLFISDGNTYWYYSVLSKRAERMKLKEAQDIQAPLAFLIGKLDFQRDFGKFLVQPVGETVTITAEPKNPQKSPFQSVAFTVGRDSKISELTIKSQDAATMIFRFSSEVRNPALAESLFTFVAPPGVEVVAGGK